MNEQFFIILAEESKKGGLFDIGATLPLVAIQFLILMFLLNLLLYNPLTTLMNQRNEYILDNLSKASNMLVTAEELTTQYETELAATKQDAQKEINDLQQIQKESFVTELNLSQNYIDAIVQKILNDFATKKQTVIADLDKEISNLATLIIKRVL
jgi:F-type H+-transporting ATPase subunit b|tara:strand:- start:42 stop:506 length:465 start_codon:yes stop_codon:yes gene_type:complete